MVAPAPNSGRLPPPTGLGHRRSARIGGRTLHVSRSRRNWTMLVGMVCDLWRYPVKSMRGERGEQLELDRRGVIGDRLYAVRDVAGKFGSGKTTRRFRRIDGLLQFRAVYDGAVPLLTFPDGTAMRGDDPAIHVALSAQLAMPVTLSREAEISHFDAGPLHLLTTASLRTLGGAQISPEHARRDRGWWLPRRHLAGPRPCRGGRRPPPCRRTNGALCYGRPRPGRAAL